MRDVACYCGRLAPSPTGWLHLGHARTFWVAHQRARARAGRLIFRSDDLDRDRCRVEFSEGMVEDLRWLGLDWDGVPFVQSERVAVYAEAFERLRAGGWIYPCRCSRQDVQRALAAPHAGEEEPVYPGTCRAASAVHPRAGVNWRFRVPDGEAVRFDDGGFGPQRAVAGVDFGDFLVWRKDDLPSYQLASTVDDALLGVTEVVRGADLITSTFRQLLIFRALGWSAPAFFHCPLVTDAAGRRLAKRDHATALRTLRESGAMPESLRAGWEAGG